MHCRQHRLRPNDRFALREPMCGISAQFLSTHQSVRLHGTISSIFFQPEAMSRISPQFLSTHQSVRLHGTISTIFFQPRAMCRISAQFLSTHQSVRLHGKTHRLFLSGRSSNGTVSVGTRFSVRVIALGKHLLLSFLSTAERRLTADRLDKIFCTRL